MTLRISNLLAAIIFSVIFQSAQAKARKQNENLPSPVPTSELHRKLYSMCEKRVSDLLAALEMQEVPRFSKIQFDFSQSQITLSEMPDMSGEGRRRKRRKAPQLPVGPAKMGYTLVLTGNVEEKAGQRRVAGRCMFYQSKLVTATYELDSIGTSVGIVVPEPSPTVAPSESPSASTSSSTTTISAPAALPAVSASPEVSASPGGAAVLPTTTTAAP